MKRIFSALVLFSCLIAAHSFAGSATWNLDPTSGDWNTAANWTPATVPNGPADIATFARSSNAAVSISAGVEINNVTFDAGASAFTMKTTATLTFSGVGITNNSGITQNFTSLTGPNFKGELKFTNGADAGSLTSFTVIGGKFVESSGGLCTFFGTSSAGNSTITNNGGAVTSASGGVMYFFDNASLGNATVINKAGATEFAFGASASFFTSATADRATFTNEGAAFNGAGGGILYFQDVTSAGNALISNNGGTVSGAGGGFIEMTGDSTAGAAIITNNGGSIAEAAGGMISFDVNATAGDATLVAEGGANGGDGGAILFNQTSRADAAHLQVFGNGRLDISNHDAPGLTAGSIEGNGIVFLGPNILTLGSNSLNTSFSGVLQDGGAGGGTGGSINKVGNGTLTLSGTNTYTGGTTINAGVLKTGNTTGSATGTGPVRLNAGSLGGQGTIAGPVTIGSGTGPGAILAPGVGSSGPRRLTLQNSLTIKADGDYVCQLNTKRARADAVIANGVVIENGAQFAFGLVGNKPLNLGKAFTILSNTSANRISGTFSNLADGTILTDGKNHYLVSYSGGDGNDLTLTVVP